MTRSTLCLLDQDEREPDGVAVRNRVDSPLAAIAVARERSLGLAPLAVPDPDLVPVLGKRLVEESCCLLEIGRNEGEEHELALERALGGDDARPRR